MIALITFSSILLPWIWSLTCSNPIEFELSVLRSRTILQIVWKKKYVKAQRLTFHYAWQQTNNLAHDFVHMYKYIHDEIHSICRGFFGPFKSHCLVLGPTPGFDWCCFYYFTISSLIVLLQAFLLEGSHSEYPMCSVCVCAHIHTHSVTVAHTYTPGPTPVALTK